MGLRFAVEEVVEGTAKILIPKLDPKDREPLDHARSRAPVFYNPIMRLNRDIAVLVLATHGRQLHRDVAACEPMCGTGIRGVRLALEAGADNVLMGDLNPSGVKLSEENAMRNGVADRVRVRELDANLMMNLHSSPMNRFDYLDVDPYGSPSTFLDSAVRSTRDGGIAALTATDMAPLCGVSPSAAIRKYSGRPLRTRYTHEVALRLLIGSVVRAAAIHEMGVIPLLCYYADHYVRAHLRLRQGATAADDALGKMGYIVHCQRCLSRVSIKSIHLKQKGACEVCGGQLNIGGPMWLGELAEGDFLRAVVDMSCEMNIPWEPRLEGFLKAINDEIGLPPTFYHLDELSSRLKRPSLNMEMILLRLREAGFRAERTHFNDRGVKTNASLADLVKIIKG